MKAPGAELGPEWQQLLNQLAELAPTPGAAKRCRHLKPAWDFFQVQRLHAETREIQQLLSQSQLFTNPLPELGNWLKAGSPSAGLLAHLELLASLYSWLQPRAAAYPELWKQLKSAKPDHELLLKLKQEKQLSKSSVTLLQKKQQPLRQQLEQLDLLGLSVARARYGKAGSLPQLAKGRHWHLQDWSPPGLELSQPLQLELSGNMSVLLISGAHGSGKSRLLLSIYLSQLMHQSGIPLRCSSSSRLPVFASLLWINSQQNVQQRLDQLKPLLHSKNTERLLLVDDFLMASNAGEAHALALAVLEHLSSSKSLSLLSTYDQLLLRQATEKGAIRKLQVERSGKQLQLHWHQTGKAQLLQSARQRGWPSELLKQAERHYAGLGQKAAKPSAPASPPKHTKTPPATRASQDAFQFKNLHSQLKTDIPVGSWVYVPALHQYGELLSTPDKHRRVQVKAQGMTLEVPADQVVLSSHRKAKKGDTGGLQIQTWSVGSEACDLHGMTVDEALPYLDKFIDVAFHQGLSQVRVVHGKGTNALRKAVHTRLLELQQQSEYIRHFRLGLPGEGDSGVTIVELH